MKWYSSKTHRPVHVGDQIIFLTNAGFIHGGIFDYHKDMGYFFERHEGDRYAMHETTHFCIPDPIERLNNE